MITNEISEQAVIGAMMFGDSADISAIRACVNASDFVYSDHEKMYRYMLSLHDSGAKVTPVLLISQFPQYKKYIADMYRELPTTVNAPEHAKAVNDAAVNRRIQDSLRLILENVSHSSLCENKTKIDELAATIETKVASESSNTVGLFELGAKKIDELSRINKSGELVGVPIGLPKIDKALGGLRPGQLIVVAGRPGLGKTAFSNQICLKAAAKGYSVGAVHLEMTKEQMIMRTFANRYDLPLTGLRNGIEKIADQLSRKISEDENYKNLKIHVDADTYRLPDILSRVMEWKRKEGIDLLIVDHIGLIKFADHDRRSLNEKLGDVSRSFKLLAKSLDIPVIILSQLNRLVEREKRKPQLSDLRDSGNIEQDVDIAMFLHADAKDEDQDMKPIEIGILKNRDGPTGWFSGIQFHGSRQKFMEITNVNYGSGYESRKDQAANQGGEREEPQELSWLSASSG